MKEHKKTLKWKSKSNSNKQKRFSKLYSISIIQAPEICQDRTRMFVRNARRNDSCLENIKNNTDDLLIKNIIKVTRDTDDKTVIQWLSLGRYNVFGLKK